MVGHVFNFAAKESMTIFVGVIMVKIQSGSCENASYSFYSFSLLEMVVCILAPSLAAEKMLPVVLMLCNMICVGPACLLSVSFVFTGWSVTTL